MRANGANRKLVLFAWTTVVVAVLAAPTVCCAAAAGWQPAKNLEIISGQSPGAGSDIIARLIQRLLTEKKLIEVPVTVVNKVGGGGTVGLVYLNQHAGDGSYLMMINPGVLTTYITGRNPINYTDTTPLAVMGTESIIFYVRADSPLQTARDLADRFKADPASVIVGFADSFGNQNHIAAAQVAKGVGANVKGLKAVVFNGSAEAVTALLGGHIDVSISSSTVVIPHFKAGKVRILAVSAEKRVTGELSAVPTWKELGIPAVMTLWRAVVGPKGMTDDQIRYWDAVLGKFAQLPEWKKVLEDGRLADVYLNASDTRKLIDAQYAELAALLSELGLASSTRAGGR